MRLVVANLDHIDAHGVHMDGAFDTPAMDDVAHNVVDKSIGNCLKLAVSGRWLAGSS